MTDNSETALDLLHAKVRAFVRDKGWDNLRAIQEKAISIVLHTRDDLIVSAGTSSGKTEAAFLPLISKILDTKASSFQVLYIAPLKALINDQYKRLSEMVRGTAVQVHRWHGDVDNHRKKALRNSPSGILQITPESIESSLINFGHQARQLYGSLDFMVIDELHAFLENERGMHLRSLLCRIAQITAKNPRYIALSATLADKAAAQRFLRPEHPDRVQGDRRAQSTPTRHSRTDLCIRFSRESQRQK